MYYPGVCVWVILFFLHCLGGSGLGWWVLGIIVTLAVSFLLCWFFYPYVSNAMYAQNADYDDWWGALYNVACKLCWSSRF